MAFEQRSETPPADEIRVASRDLALALSVIDARRLDESQRGLDTVALGSAIRQLGLEVTAEELLEEIRTLHAADEHAAEEEAAYAASHRLSRLARAAAWPVALLLLCVLPIATYFYRAEVGRADAVARRWEAAAQLENERARYASEHGHDLNYLLERGQIATVSLDAIQMLVRGVSAAAIRTDAPGWSGSWAIVSIDGRLYVRAYCQRPVHGRVRVLSSVDDWNTSHRSRRLYRRVLVPLASFKGIHDPAGTAGRYREDVYLPEDAVPADKSTGHGRQ